MRNDLDRAEQRTRRYWYDDGLTEIGVGCLFAAIGALFLIEALAPQGSLPGSFSAIGIVVLVGGGMWIINWAVKKIKARLTYPRTGYVQYRRQPHSGRRRLVAAAVGAGVSMAVVIALFATAPASLAWLPALEGLFIGCFILYMAYMVGLVRFYFLAVASFATGPAASLAGLGDTFGLGVYMATMGLLFLLSGGIVLWSYLRSTSPAGGE